MDNTSLILSTIFNHLTFTATQTLSYTIIWQAKRASNPQPSVLETDTLPIELLACRYYNYKHQKLR
jgi:hypothetical protein